MQHRKGKRTAHAVEEIGVAEMGEVMPLPTGTKMGVAADEGAAEVAEGEDGSGAAALAGEHEAKTQRGLDWLRHCAFVPLRLSEEERSLLAVVQGSLAISEYTDKVDVFRYWNKQSEIDSQWEELFGYLTGLLACSDLREGSRRGAESFADNAEFFQRCCEVGRRYKVMNPEKMRSTYGKLMHAMQDAATAATRRSLGITLRVPLRTVKDFLEERRCTGLLDDPMVQAATRALDGGSSAAEAALKRKAIEELCSRFATAACPAADIELVLSSIADSEAYKAVSQAPIRKMLDYLGRHFSPGAPKSKTSNLAISSGRGGSCLSHDHATQFKFVQQSLTLWHEVQEMMFQLWTVADDDLLGGGGEYRLCNTGQGMNRVQGCPRVSQLMHRILRSVQDKFGGWVGLSVVHLGDRDVPNALVFIDKYAQVPRILGPIVHTIEALDEVCAADEAIATYIDDEFGGPDALREEILGDFFRHGFDGSGSDGGSCIDGRLTSAWNWCSRLEKKPYYRVFLLCGFTGFDGDWRAN